MLCHPHSCSTLVIGLKLKCRLLPGKAALAVSRRAFADEQPMHCVVSSLCWLYVSLFCCSGSCLQMLGECSVWGFGSFELRFLL